MNPEELLLGTVKLLRKRGQPIPIDLLAKADQLGLSLVDIDEPSHLTETDKGAETYGNTEED